MKKNKLIKILRKHGCVFVEHGRKHDVYKNPATEKTERVPRHTDVDEHLAWQIIKNLS
jgi:predicted RNA binding protein YcfA (HicA-like mRNA interferase family)